MPTSEEFMVILFLTAVLSMLLVALCQCVKKYHLTRGISTSTRHENPENGTIFYTRGSRIGFSENYNYLLKDIPYCKPNFDIYSEPPPPYLTQEEIERLQNWYKNSHSNDSCQVIDDLELPFPSTSQDAQLLNTPEELHNSGHVESPDIMQVGGHSGDIGINNEAFSNSDLNAENVVDQHFSTCQAINSNTQLSFFCNMTYQQCYLAERTQLTMQTSSTNIQALPRVE